MYVQISPTILQKTEDSGTTKHKGFTISHQTTETLTFDDPGLLENFVATMQAGVDERIEQLSKEIEAMKSRPVIR